MENNRRGYHVSSNRSKAIGYLVRKIILFLIIKVLSDLHSQFDIRGSFER